MSLKKCIKCQTKASTCYFEQSPNLEDELEILIFHNSEAKE